MGWRASTSALYCTLQWAISFRSSQIQSNQGYFIKWKASTSALYCTCGWLGLKHQLTNKISIAHSSELFHSDPAKSNPTRIVQSNQTSGTLLGGELVPQLSIAHSSELFYWPEFKLCESLWMNTLMEARDVWFLESQGCHLIPLYYLLSCSSAYSHCSFCLIFLSMPPCLFWLKIIIYFYIEYSSIFFKR